MESPLQVIRKAEYWTRNLKPFQSSTAVVKKAASYRISFSCIVRALKMCTHVLLKALVKATFNVSFLRLAVSVLKLAEETGKYLSGSV